MKLARSTLFTMFRRSTMALIFYLVFAALTLTALIKPSPSDAKVSTVSTDGEATVYLDHADFARDFDLSYDTGLDASPTNRSWTIVGLMLLGHSYPSASIEVGLTRGDAKNTSAAVFTAANQPRRPSRFDVTANACVSRCRLELRGGTATVEALLNGQVIKSWARSGFPMKIPYVQINAEVSQRGDHLRARLQPVTTTAAGHILSDPTCGFTTRGIEVRRADHAALVFTGTYREDAQVTYLSLENGSTGDTCEAIRPPAQRKKH